MVAKKRWRRLRKGRFLFAYSAFLLVLFLGASFAFSQPQGLAKPARKGIIPGRYIVVLRDYVQKPELAAERLARLHRFGLRHVYKRALKGFAAEIPEAILQRLKTDPDIAYVEPDRMVYAVQQEIPTGVDRVNADQNSVAKIDGVDERVDVDVAIIDTGVDLDHPDLNVSSSTDCARFRGGCRDGKGNDGNGHGSHVAGTVGALDNSIGVVGVAPGVRLWAVRVLNDSGSGYLSWVLNGIDWVTTHADSIEVANMSLAWQGYSAAARTAIQNSVAAGVVYVVAAGNDATDVYGPDNVLGTNDDICPASFPEVAAISALADFDGKPGGEAGGSDDSFASFTNSSGSVVGDNPVASPGAAIDLLCPGVDILSTYMNGGYAIGSGTSMASPHAAGLAALYIAENDRAMNAAGVYAIRQALIDNGVLQTAAEGLATLNDPDENLENLGWAGTAAPFKDIAVMSLEADPSSAVSGVTVTVTVEVRNVGTTDVTYNFVVLLVSDNTTPSAEGDDITIGGQTIEGLARGDYETLTFDWNTEGVNLGDHILKASHKYHDEKPANDEQTTTVTVTDTAVPTSTHVANLDGYSTGTPWWFIWQAVVTVTVQDNLANPVPDARVDIRWSDGSTDWLVTDGNGRCTFLGFQWAWIGSLTLTVTNISHATLAYDPSSNGPTSITLHWP